MSAPVPIRPAPAVEATFEQFWFLYPRKVDKALARAKWDAITGDGLTTRTLDRDSGQYVVLALAATPAAILAGLRHYLASIPRKPNSYEYLEPQYIPHPATFLNRGRWMDTG